MVQQHVGGGADEHVRTRPITSVLDAVIVLDDVGTVLEWSPATEELFGLERDVAVGLDLIELIVPAALRESARDSLLDEERSAEESLGRRIELTARRGDDSEFQVELTIGRAAEGGAGPTVFARDVSHRAEVEQTRAHLALVVAGTQDAVLSKDLDGMVTSWNPAAETLYGYTSEEAVGRHVSFLMPDELKHDVDKILGAVRRGEVLDTYETRRVRKDGVVIDVALTISPITAIA